MMPAPWSSAPASELKRIRGVCLDIDDTLTSHGKLRAEAYSALWRLKNSGLRVVPITGRPAGWCDHFARFWPVDAVVGENGAFTFLMKPRTGGGEIRDRLETPGAISDDTLRRKKLAELAQTIRARFPQARFASDQAYREHDLAIDFCEDVPAWPRSEIDELVKLCEQSGAHAKISSIHVNTWFGEFDKVKGFSHFLDSHPEMPKKEEWIFIGDSPNDEPMFRHFPNSVGVANLRDFMDRLSHPPRWMTAAESGAGFVEMTEKLLQSTQQGTAQ